MSKAELVKTVVDKTFAESFNILSAEVNQWARSQGFWEGEGCSVGDKIALMHSELSEALEAQRNSNPPDDKIPDYSGLEAEMADVYVPMCGDSESERDFNSRCQDVKDDCLAVVDKKIKDVQGR